MKLEQYGVLVVAAVAMACASTQVPAPPAAPAATSETQLNAAAWQLGDENTPRVGKAQHSAAPGTTDAGTLGMDKEPRRDDGRGSSFSGYK
jgi:hypothetical protein